MKKFRFPFGIISIIGLAIFMFWGCKDKDKFSPLIFITGSETVTTELERVYVDSGATCEDNADGNLTSSMVVGHNIPKKLNANGDSIASKAGDFEVHYSITDKAGNVKEATRYVKVRNWASIYEPPIAQFRLYRTKISHMADSVGCQYGKYKYRKIVQKVSLTTDKIENKRLKIPLGGEIKASVWATFNSNNKNITIGQQIVDGQKGYYWSPSGSGIDTAKVKYSISGYGASKDSSKVINNVQGMKTILLKYYISTELGTPVIYQDCLVLIYYI